MYLSEYEEEQLRAIKKWKKEECSVVDTALSYVRFPICRLIQSLVPASAIQGVIDGTNAAALWLTDEADILKKSAVKDIDELRIKGIMTSDKLANDVHNWAIGLASAEGVGTGVWGLYGLAVDIPFILTLALRSIHKIGLCYGYKAKDEKDRQFVLTVLSASGANSAREKTDALKILQTIDIMVAKQTLKTIAEKAAQQQLSKEAVVISMKNLGRQIGINILERKVLQAIPAIGAVVGGSVNSWFIKDVGWAARRAFQERWFMDNGKIQMRDIEKL